MKRSLVLFGFILLFSISSFAAEPITVTFTAEASSLKTGKLTDGKLLYPKVGFWDIEIAKDWQEKSFSVMSQEAKDMLGTTPEGKRLLESFYFRHTLGISLAYGSMPVFITTAFISARNYSDTGMVVSIWSLYIGMLTGVIIAAYSYDDFYMSVNEYNKTVLNEKISLIDSPQYLAANFRF